MLSTAWIISTLEALPQLFVFRVLQHPVHEWYTQCVSIWFPLNENAWDSKTYIVFGMVMIYFLPLVVIVLTYSIILYTIYQKSRPENANDQSGDGLRRSGAGV